MVWRVYKQLIWPEVSRFLQPAFASELIQSMQVAGSIREETPEGYFSGTIWPSNSAVLTDAKLTSDSYPNIGHHALIMSACP